MWLCGDRSCSAWIGNVFMNSKLSMTYDGYYITRQFNKILYYTILYYTILYYPILCNTTLSYSTPWSPIYATSHQTAPQYNTIQNHTKHLLSCTWFYPKLFTMYLKYFITILYYITSYTTRHFNTMCFVVPDFTLKAIEFLLANPSSVSASIITPVGDNFDWHTVTYSKIPWNYVLSKVRNEKRVIC